MMDALWTILRATNNKRVMLIIIYNFIRHNTVVAQLKNKP